MCHMCADLQSTIVYYSRLGTRLSVSYVPTSSLLQTDFSPVYYSRLGKRLSIAKRKGNIHWNV
jgi:hypothetical protein